MCSQHSSATQLADIMAHMDAKMVRQRKEEDEAEQRTRLQQRMEELHQIYVGEIYNEESKEEQLRQKPNNVVVNSGSN